MARYQVAATINTVDETFPADIKPGADATSASGNLTTHSATLTTDAASLATDQTSLSGHSGNLTTHQTSLSGHSGNLTTHQTTTLADIDAFAAAVIAITGDSYASHQFTFGGATGLTHAEVATTFALLNTAITAYLTTQTDAASVATDNTNLGTDATAIATDTTNLGTDSGVLTTDAANVAADASSIAKGVGADLTVSFNASNVKSKNGFVLAMRAIIDRVVNGTTMFSS